MANPGQEPKEEDKYRSECVTTITYFQVVCDLTLQYKNQLFPPYCFQVPLIYRVSIHTTSLLQPV